MRVRRPGTQRPAGKPVATIESGKWAGPVPNLFDCMIASANQQVLDAPALLNQYPYQAWIARVQPAAPVAQVLARWLPASAHTGITARARKDDIHCRRVAS